MAKYSRRQQFVDRKVQGAIMLRVGLYWVLCMMSMILMILSWRMITGPSRPVIIHLDELWFRYSPIVIMSLLLLPVLLVDAIGMSNRFAGPMVRLRRSMRSLADGERATPVHFRDNDFWQDLGEDYNRVLARFQPKEEPNASACAGGVKPTEAAAGSVNSSDAERELVAS